LKGIKRKLIDWAITCNMISYQIMRNTSVKMNQNQTLWKNQVLIFHPSVNLKDKSIHILNQNHSIKLTPIMINPVRNKLKNNQSIKLNKKLIHTYLNTKLITNLPYHQTLSYKVNNIITKKTNNWLIGITFHMTRDSCKLQIKRLSKLI